MVFTTVRRRKIHEDVAAQLEEAIISGTYAEGDQLPPERELMETFGVGRPAVREALLLLERSGVVQLSPGERARVVHPTMDGLVDQISASARHFLATAAGERSLQQARRVIEAAIARHAAEEATAEEIDRLGQALEANRRTLGSVEAFETTDVAFHLAIAEIGGNQVFSAMHRAIVGWLSLQRRVSLRSPEALPAALRHHEAVYEAIAAHEPERAWQAMTAHIRDVERWYNKGRTAEARTGPS
jgi:DNA-binding FadR family transcriptional regulator